MADALLVSSSFLPGTGGIETHLAELCEAVSPRLAVLAPASRDGKTLPAGLGYETYAGRPSLLYRPHRGLVGEIAAICARLDVSRVVFGTPWPLGLIAPGLHAHGLTYAMALHAAEVTIPARLPLVGRRLLEALSGADRLFPVSDNTAGLVERLLKARGLAVPSMDVLPPRVDTTRFHPGVPGDRLRDALGIAQDAPVVAFMSRLVHRKGAHRLVEIMPEVAQRVPGAVAVIAGTGPQLDDLRRKVRASGAPVVLPGRLPDEDAPALYATASVFAFPVVDRYGGLETEGLGVVLLEAEACATPCVTGRSGGTTEAVIDGRTGYVIDGTDLHALTERVVQLLGQRDRAADMGAEARRLVERRFSHELPPEPLLRWLER